MTLWALVIGSIGAVSALASGLTWVLERRRPHDSSDVMNHDMKE